jgi:predicted nucleic acid-binding protein
LILVDTSVWIDHLRSGDSFLAKLLDAGRVLTHPFVIGEVALGHLRQRDIILATLSDLPRAEIAQESEVLRFIHQQSLFGRGIGYIDAHLLTAVRLTPETELWTKDNRLRQVAHELGSALKSQSGEPV